jgi:hypothetical protein
VTANKQHTHTGANCGYKLRAAPGYDSARAAARPGGSGPPGPPGKGPCYLCGGAHFKSECEKFAKLQNNAAFMAVQETYEPDEIADLNLLISTTNRDVCKWCLMEGCSGSPLTCKSESVSMSRTKQKFFNNGSYEYVAAAKMDRPVLFGHSPFNKNAYLSTYGAREAEGADEQRALPREIQEDICIRSKLTKKSADKADILQAGLDRDYEDMEVGDYNPGAEDSSGQEDSGSGSPGPGQ